MKYSNDVPVCGKVNGEERFYIFLTDYDSFSLDDITFCKVKCVRRWYDKENSSFAIDGIVLEEYFTKGRIGKKAIIDHTWQLQRTKETAQRLLIVLAMNYGSHLSYEDTLPI